MCDEILTRQRFKESYDDNKTQVLLGATVYVFCYAKATLRSHGYMTRLLSRQTIPQIICPADGALYSTTDHAVALRA